MGRDELSEEYYDDDDMWLSDDDWDEREPPSEETLSKLRECFPRMADDAKLRLVMTLAELSEDGELLDLMGACIDDSRGVDTSDVRERAWTAVRDGLSMSDKDRSKGVNIDGEFMYTAQDPTVYRAREIGETFIELFRKGHLDEVYVVYTEMVTPMQMEPKMVKLLPLDRDAFPSYAECSCSECR